MFSKLNIELVAHVLLMPFLDVSFNEEGHDRIINLVKAYYDMCNTDKAYNIDYEKQYIKAMKEIESYRFKDVWIHNLDEFHMLLDMFYPVEFISRKYNDDNDNVLDYYIGKIFHIASNFITFRDGRVSIRLNEDTHHPDMFTGYRSMNKIELWSVISRIIPVDVFIAAHYINSCISNESMQKYFIHVPPLVDLCDIPLKKIMDKGVAETHMHMNAGFSYVYSWQHEMDIEGAKINKIGKYYAEALFRIIFAEFLEHPNIDCTFLRITSEEKEKERQDKVIYNIFCANKTDSQSLIADNIVRLNKLISDIKYQNCNKHIETVDFLERTIYSKYNNLDTNGEMIFLYKSLQYLSHSPTGKRGRFARKMFIRYIRCKSEFFANKLQSNKIGGLDYFSEYYHNSTRISGIGRKTIHLEMFREQCKSRALKKIEVRRAPPLPHNEKGISRDLKSTERNIVNDVKVLLEAYVTYVKNFRRIPDKTAEIPGLGIIYHFIKRMGADNYNGRSCIMSKRIFDKYQNNDYYSMRKVYDMFVNTLNSVIKKYPLLSKYIVGFDTASRENDTEPWVFAPVFMNIRNRESTIPVDSDNDSYINNLGFTYHVGEDFRHLLSGLRHIDEVIENFGYMPGDRIGHAVALGADVRDIIGVNKIICMPIMEHLENMLWLWGIVNKTEGEIGLEGLEYKIMRTAKEIYKDEFFNINIYMLREAYDKKFRPLSERQESMIEKCRNILDKTTSGINSFCMLEQEKNFAWDSDTLMCTHFCPCYFKRYKQPVFVEITENEAVVMEKIQKLIINKLEQKGIYVETNPTSNVAITDIDGIMKHPIFKLNNRGLTNDVDNESSVLVTINSDDPNVFSTNIENEFAIIYHSLVYHGYSRENILSWIDKVRQHGLDSAFVRRSLTLDELEADLAVLENILKQC